MTELAQMNRIGRVVGAGQTTRGTEKNWPSDWNSRSVFQLTLLKITHENDQIIVMGDENQDGPAKECGGWDSRTNLVH